MDKFLGLPIVRKPLTDSQCVERARKDIKRFKRYGIWLLPLSFIPLIILGFVTDKVRIVLVNAGGNQGAFWGGILIGIVCGLPLGIVFFQFLDFFLKTIGLVQGDRSSELLVKYHDMLAELAHAEDKPPPNEAEQGRAGGSG